MADMIYKHEFIKDAVIAIETGLLYVYGPLTVGDDLAASGVMVMIMILFMLRDVDVTFIKKLKRKYRMVPKMNCKK